MKFRNRLIFMSNASIECQPRRQYSFKRTSTRNNNNNDRKRRKTNRIVLFAKLCARVTLCPATISLMVLKIAPGINSNLLVHNSSSFAVAFFSLSLLPQNVNATTMKIISIKCWFWISSALQVRVCVCWCVCLNSLLCIPNMKFEAAMAANFVFNVCFTRDVTGALAL